MTDPSVNSSPTRHQPEDSSAGQAGPVHRKISVKGSGGVGATVVVIAHRGQVRVSIVPPFTWEAIMEPGKIDEVIHVLALARDDAKKMAVARERSASRGDKVGAPGAQQQYGYSVS